MRTSRAGFASAAAALALFASFGCGESGAPGLSDRNVLVIVVDTLRADHMGSYGYERDTTPRIDELASEGTLFRRANSVSSWTKPAVASILTGLYPKAHRVQRVKSKLREGLRTLAELLSAEGYQTAAVVSHTLLAADSGYGQGFDVYLEDHAKGHGYTSTPGVTSQALALLDAFSQEPDRPFFLFAHYFDPHYTYNRHPEFGFSEAGDVGRLSGKEDIMVLRAMSDSLSGEELQFLRDLYDEEIRFTDAGIGRLIDGLRERGLADDTLVVVTADHGEEFRERGWLGHTRTLYNELIRVPLVVRDPWIEEPVRIVGPPVSTVSVTPTVLDALEIQTNVPFQEPSLRPLMLGAPTGPSNLLYSEVDFVPVYSANAVKATSKVALMGPRFKIVWDRETLSYELYDLYTDPAESQDVSQANPKVLQRLLPLVREHAREPERRLVTPPHERLELDPEQVEHLRALGYAEP